MPRSQLEITTSSVLRLVKEESSYHSEIQQQEERLAKLEKGEGGDDENREYMLKQEVRTHLLGYCMGSARHTTLNVLLT